MNYELDHTIDHVKDPTGTLRRLSVAVVVNYREGKDGKPEPLSPAEMTKISDLVHQAVGFSAARGDTVSVINSPFNTTAPENPPFWRDPYYLSLAMQGARYLLALIVIALIWRRVLRPLMRSATEARHHVDAEASTVDTVAAEDAEESRRQAAENSRHEDNLNVARSMAGKDPRAVAMVLRSWMEKNAKA